MPKQSNHSQAQTLLGIHLRELGFERIVYEFEFAENRKYRADVYLPDIALLIDVDGGVDAFRDKNGTFHAGAGHKRGTALAEDYLRDNVAQLLGYKIFRFTNKQVLSGEAKDFLASWGEKL